MTQLFESLSPAVAALVAVEWRDLGSDVAALLPSSPSTDGVGPSSAPPRTSTVMPRRACVSSAAASSCASPKAFWAAGSLGRLIGTRRSLLRSSSTFRSGNNSLVTVVELDEPTHVRLRANEVLPLAELLAGCIEALVTFTGGKQVQVALTLEPAHTLYDIRWR